jgi:hypothetical protein
MKSLLNFAGAIALSCLAVQSEARVVGYSPKDLIRPYKREPLQDIVSQDWVNWKRTELANSLG